MSETINVTRSSMPPFAEFCEEIRDLWESRWLTNMGAKHQALEAALRDYLGCGHLALHTNGHLALENLIEAFGLKGEIITTPFTFASTTHAIVRCGCTPVFGDIDPGSFTLDPRASATGPCSPSMPPRSFIPLRGAWPSAGIGRRCSA